MRIQKKFKKKFQKFLEIIWILLGILMFLWTLLWFIEIHLPQNSNVLVEILLFIWGLVVLGFYLILTLLFLLIKWIIKKLKRKK